MNLRQRMSLRVEHKTRLNYGLIIINEMLINIFLSSLPQSVWPWFAFLREQLTRHTAANCMQIRSRAKGIIRLLLITPQPLSHQSQRSFDLSVNLHREMIKTRVIFTPSGSAVVAHVSDWEWEWEARTTNAKDRTEAHLSISLWMELLSDYGYGCGCRQMGSIWLLILRT